MKKTIFFLMVFVFQHTVSYASALNDLNFQETKTAAILAMRYNGDPKFQVTEDKQNSQLVVDVLGANLPARFTRVIDLSTSSSPVVQITPYNTGDRGGDAKVVIQLKKNTDYAAKNSGGLFELKIFSSQQKNNHIHLPPLSVKKKSFSRKPFIAGTWVEGDDLVLKSSAIGGPDSGTEVAKQLIETLNSDPEIKTYRGSKVDFEGSNVDVHDIFRLVGDKSGLNIITAEDVKANMSVSLKNVPWDQLLDVVLQQNKLKASAVGNVVRITTLASYNEEQLSKKNTIAIEQDLEPVVMAIVPLSYAKAEEMKAMIENLVVKQEDVEKVDEKFKNLVEENKKAAAAGTPGASNAASNLMVVKELAQAFNKGKIEVDGRSNSLVITNTANVIERIKRLVKELDIALPQVLIESKIVIASDRFAKDLGVSWGGRLTSGGSQRAGVGLSFNGVEVNANNPSGDEVAAFSLTGSGGNSGTGSAAAGGVGFTLGAGKAANLNMKLNISELEGNSKTIASPRIIVNNKKTATVTDGLKVANTGSTASGGAAITTTTYTEAALSLSVTPQITSAGSVLMTLKIQKDIPEGNNISTKSINTEVLVDSGSTLVLGGVYQYAANKFLTGIPLLKDLPFVGRLFSMESESLTKSELMVFVTPKILETGPAASSEIVSQ